MWFSCILATQRPAPAVPTMRRACAPPGDDAGRAMVSSVAYDLRPEQCIRSRGPLKRCEEQMTTQSHDILITGGRVYTADPEQPWAQAVLLRGDRIQYVGSEAGAVERAGSGVERVQVPGS